jgi:hypothetical protein
MTDAATTEWDEDEEEWIDVLPEDEDDAMRAVLDESQS